MSVYIPLATKYRPQKFADVVGQDITVKIITNGMMKNRLGAAMLFSGTRGIGKTTLARIIAKALRCENSNPEPCGKCEACKSFDEGNQIDVIEIDAASNTGVDDVREIIESCRYKPTTGKFKIFIIDEVHMLSNSAFNALLKTLEEPPEHVKFIMATTETYKIPETILSRVLKFDLKRISEDVLTQHLSSICNQEKIVAGADALRAIAKAADGSIRDSLSILDQVINVADKNEISLEDVRNILGLSDESDVIDLFKLILSTDAKTAVKKFRELLEADISCEKIANTILDYIHAVTCIKSGIEVRTGEVSESVMPRLKTLADTVSIPAMTRVWQMLLRGIEEIKMCDRPEIVMEMIIVRIAYASGLPDLADIIEGRAKISSERPEKTGKAESVQAENVQTEVNELIGTIEKGQGSTEAKGAKAAKDVAKGSLFKETHSDSGKTAERGISENGIKNETGRQSEESSESSLVEEALKMFPDAIVS